MLYWSADTLVWKLSINMDVWVKHRLYTLDFQASKCDISHPLTWRADVRTYVWVDERTDGRFWRNQNFLDAWINKFHYPWCSATRVYKTLIIKNSIQSFLHWKYCKSRVLFLYWARRVLLSDEEIIIIAVIDGRYLPSWIKYPALTA